MPPAGELKRPGDGDGDGDGDAKGDAPPNKMPKVAGAIQSKLGSYFVNPIWFGPLIAGPLGARVFVVVCVRGCVLRSRHPRSRLQITRKPQNARQVCRLLSSRSATGISMWCAQCVRSELRRTRAAPRSHRGSAICGPGPASPIGPVSAPFQRSDSCVVALAFAGGSSGEPSGSPAPLKPTHPRRTLEPMKPISGSAVAVRHLPACAEVCTPTHPR